MKCCALCECFGAGSRVVGDTAVPVRRTWIPCVVISHWATWRRGQGQVNHHFARRPCDVCNGIWRFQLIQDKVESSFAEDLEAPTKRRIKSEEKQELTDEESFNWLKPVSDGFRNYQNDKVGFHIPPEHIFLDRANLPFLITKLKD